MNFDLDQQSVWCLQHGGDASEPERFPDWPENSPPSSGDHNSAVGALNFCQLHRRRVPFGYKIVEYMYVLFVAEVVLIHSCEAIQRH